MDKNKFIGDSIRKVVDLSESFDPLTKQILDAENLQDLANIRRESISAYEAIFDEFQKEEFQTVLVVTSKLEDMQKLLCIYQSKENSLKLKINKEFHSSCRQLADIFTLDKEKPRQQLERIVSDFRASRNDLGTEGFSRHLVDYDLFLQEVEAVDNKLDERIEEFGYFTFDKKESLEDFRKRCKSEIVKGYKKAVKNHLTAGIPFGTPNSHILKGAKRIDEAKDFIKYVSEASSDFQKIAEARDEINSEIEQIEKINTLLSNSDESYDYIEWLDGLHVRKIETSEKEFSYLKNLVAKYDSACSAIPDLIARKRKTIGNGLNEQLAKYSGLQLPEEQPLEKGMQQLSDYRRFVIDISEKAGLLGNQDILLQSSRLVESIDERIGHLKTAIDKRDNKVYEEKTGEEVVKVYRVVVEKEKEAEKSKPVMVLPAAKIDIEPNASGERFFFSDFVRDDLEAPEDSSYSKCSEILTNAREHGSWPERLNLMCSELIYFKKPQKPADVNYFRQFNTALQRFYSNGMLGDLAQKSEDDKREIVKCLGIMQSFVEQLPY